MVILGVVTQYQNNMKIAEVQDKVYYEFIKKYYKNAEYLDQLFQIFYNHMHFIRSPVSTLLQDLGLAKVTNKPFQMVINLKTAEKQKGKSLNELKCYNCCNELPKAYFSENDCATLKNHFMKLFNEKAE